MRRPVWMAAGVALGVGGTLWAERRVRRAVRQVGDRLAPSNAAAGARALAGGAGHRLREAVEVGRDERARRERELWLQLDDDAAPVQSPSRRRPGARRPAGGRGRGGGLRR